MAKDNQEGSSIQYKVLLRPTDIGLLVMKRLHRPHVDKSAELRRMIELGYAAEQAGFILDGTILRHAGRVWDIQPDMCIDATTLVGFDLPQKNVSEMAPLERRTVSAKPSSNAPPESISASVSASKPVEDNASTGAESSLRINLRGLSG